MSINLLTLFLVFCLVPLLFYAEYLRKREPQPFVSDARLVALSTPKWLAWCCFLGCVGSQPPPSLSPLASTTSITSTNPAFPNVPHSILYR